MQTDESELGLRSKNGIAQLLPITIFLGNWNKAKIIKVGVNQFLLYFYGYRGKNLKSVFGPYIPPFT